MKHSKVECDDQKYHVLDITILGADIQKAQKEIAEAKCIFQGVKDIGKNGFFSIAYITIQVLVPDDKYERACQLRF